MWGKEDEKMRRNALREASRIVIKVGTSSVTDDKGQTDITGMSKLVAQISQLCREGKDVLLVSSGAVGTGMNVLNQAEPPVSLDLKQALAAVGQGRLIRIYEDLFSQEGIQLAQVLLTPDALEHPMKHENTFRALRVMFDLGVVPLLNENDALACDGFRFGDNDRLSARIAEVVDADLLIILSDIDGLYEEDPRVNPQAVFVETVEVITSAMEDHSRTRGTGVSCGGMYSKLQAARVAMRAGIPMVIANFAEEKNVERILAGETLGTLFWPSCNPTGFSAFRLTGDIPGCTFPALTECPLSGVVTS